MYNISVVIPTYNRADRIERSIRSVLDQRGQGDSYVIIEVLIIDDGSADNTEQIVKGISDERVTYFCMPVNSGPAVARNKGVELASGSWIAFQDSDDIWHEDKLTKQVKYLIDNPAVMVSHPIRAVFDDGSMIVTNAVNAEDLVPAIAVKNYFDTPTMLINREVFLKTGGFNTELKALEDWEFALRMAAHYKIGMVSDALLDSYIMSNGVSSDASNYYESRCKMIAWNRDILTAHNCFDLAVKSLLMHAKDNNVLEIVGRMFEIYLGEG